MENIKNETKILLIYRVYVDKEMNVSTHMQYMLKEFNSHVVLPEHVKLVMLPDFKETSFEVIDLSVNSDVINIEELEQLVGKEKEELINVRISKIEKSILLQKCKKYGFKHLSEYLRFVGLNSNIDVK